MKLFQIEEPDGAAVDPDAPGAAVGMAIAPDGKARVAIALGGNAELLPDGDGNRALDGSGRPLDALLLDLRARAERQLARPVTHAVIAADLAADTVERAAAAAGIAVLRLLALKDAAGAKASDEAAVLAAAILAEDLLPSPLEGEGKGGG
jgi:hypothetical protein